jgi:hypothetical protein
MEEGELQDEEMRPSPSLAANEPSSSTSFLPSPSLAEPPSFRRGGSMGTPSVKPGSVLGRKKWAGCASIDEFRIEEKVGEGTFGIVNKAVHLKSGKTVALKKILLRPEQEGV